MTKVVIYRGSSGRFVVPLACIQYIKERTDDVYDIHGFREPKVGEPLVPGAWSFINRTDPVFVEWVETNKSELKVVDIPDGVDWVLESNQNGVEWIAERHRIWY